ncbi:hypothetical protein AJ79_07459 [Helicocarpus griseus UAMH5409]|uniref:Uncharacterized protein n=1 Tax=Helicocarpus griseus UAMH5409 TaxID=1447875 RepID=A0A2B7X2X3_9EURO|nr:hypothetical protein AJ79_07459 [Helicocarpus griseus UAMH5409]
MSTNPKQTGYQQSENGMLQSGMYACPSAYLVYPPDRTGQRPSQHTLLQYASPADRRCHENLRLVQQQQYDAANHSRNATYAGRMTQGYGGIIDEPERHLHYRSGLQSKEDRSENSAFEKAEDRRREKKEPPRRVRSPRRRFTRVWTCCQNCSAPGPYSSLYSRCMGCEAPRCPNCIEMCVPAQESPIQE